jgi:hypothetical protein
VALWQFKVTLLPRRWLDDGGSLASLIGKDGWDTKVAWKGLESAKLRSRIEGILPCGKSWHAAVTIWGSEDRSDIQLSENRERVEELYVRFDLRQPDMSLFKAIFALAQHCDLAVVDMARKRTVADLNELVRAAAESDAAHFVLDPASFLEQVGVSARAT